MAPLPSCSAKRVRSVFVLPLPPLLPSFGYPDRMRARTQISIDAAVRNIYYFLRLINNTHSGFNIEIFPTKTSEI